MSNGHGGARPGGGRKTKAEELGLTAMIDDVIGEDGMKEIFKVIHAKSKAGSFQHTQLLCSYYYGKPVDHREINLNSNVQVQWGDEEETT